MHRAEAVLLALILAAGLLPLVVTVAVRSRSLLRPGLMALALALPVAAAAALFARPPQPRDETISQRPIEVSVHDYVTSDMCAHCHPEQYESWHSSYHRTMTQEATQEAVVGDFEDVELRAYGLTYRLSRSDGRFWVETRYPGQNGAAAERTPVVMTTGSHHEQVYWLPTGKGRELEPLPFIYLKHEQAWTRYLSVFLDPADRGSPPPFDTNIWGSNCLHCHTTHGQPRLRIGEPADTRVAEFGIACETCHGPARVHVEANRNPVRRYALHLDGDDPTVVQPARLDHRRASQVCGQCHSVWQPPLEEQLARAWYERGFLYRPGEDLHAIRRVIHPKDEMSLRTWPVAHEYRDEFLSMRFWSDGMVRVSGREYNGLIDSPCYQRGELSCLSCHQLHKSSDDARPLSEWADDQLKPGMRGNAACLQCHTSLGDDLSEHTHHAAASSGSQCYNCHMPYTSYGLLKAIRSHEIFNPTVQGSLETGRPVACNQCHLDQTLDWTARRLADWYGIRAPELSPDERTIAASLLWLLRGDAGQRALAAWSMGWEDARETSGSDWIPPLLATAVDDPYNAVRFIALRSLRKTPALADLEYDYLTEARKATLTRYHALEAWEKARGDQNHTGTTGPALLTGPDGRVDRDLLERLLGERDERRVILRE